jgi:hypothetical protein
VRTPWKLLYDLTDRIIPYDSPTAAFFGGRLWLLLVGLTMAALIELVFLLAHWIAPESQFAHFMASNFWVIWILLIGFFFFYWFFRMVWDGLKQPTVGVTAGKPEADQ